MSAVRIAISCIAVLIFATPGEGQQVVQGSLRPGDIVKITVWRQPELSGQFTVLADGTLAHPLYREIRVSGVPLEAIDDSVGKVLRKLESNPDFVVEPFYRVVVSGEVRTPSVYTVPPTTTLAEAVAMAGGATDRGKLESVRFQRAGVTQVVDLNAAELTVIANTRLQSGDQIQVSRRSSVFRDYIVPAGTITAALAAVLNLVLR